MTNRLLLAAALPALLLAGCSGTRNRGLESVHQPVVDRSDYAIDLAADSGALAPGEDGRLDGWLRTMRVGYGDVVAVDDAGGRSDAAAAQIGGVVARYGLLVAQQAPVTAQPIPSGAVRVVVSRMRAGVPGCPDWSRNLTNDFEGHSHSNFGCATNGNLAAMVANSADLVKGRGGAGLADAAASYKAIDRYRTAPPTSAEGLKIENAGGKK